jgi:demethylmenaquinone methyltransferase/2-methoxy-6-polyprenyl-1,4-benzoquinol methylase
MPVEGTGLARARRILVLGPSGSGKSTFARRLARIRRLPVVHLDVLSWQAGWVQTPTDQFTARVESAVRQPAWVMDGGYSQTLHLRLPRSDHVVLLRASRFRCMFNVLRRWATWRGRQRPDIAPGCPEKIDLEFAWWVLWVQGGHHARTMRRLVEMAPEKPVTVLRSGAESDRLLASMESGSGPEREPAAVRRMFDRIARRYDLVNTVLSLGSDRGWRRRAVRETGVGEGGAALDIACGSGKIALELAGRGSRVTGLDFSPEMLAVAHRTQPETAFVRGDALALPFPDGAFQAATMGFGLRNLVDPTRGLEEMARVLRPGGRAAVLEFLRPPPTPFGRLYRLYLRTVLPWIGGLLSGDRDAYRYLSETVDSYRTPAELRELARAAGWMDVRLVELSIGTVAVLSGTPGPVRPPARPRLGRARPASSGRRQARPAPAP